MRNRTHDRTNIPIDETTLDVCRGAGPLYKDLRSDYPEGARGDVSPPRSPPPGGNQKSKYS